MGESTKHDIAIVGAGFTGLSAALELANAGARVLVVEADSAVGGLAGTFSFRTGVHIEKFYHHWFTNDAYIPQLAGELGVQDRIITLPSRTGMYYNSRIWRLSTPLDLLRFSALSLLDRVRLGLLVFQVRRIKDWRSIEHLSIREWLEPLCGRQVFKTVWEPLIHSKFSIHADAVSAVWFWKKLVLRGSTRDRKGAEQLAYFRGGFGAMAEAMAQRIRKLGGTVELSAPVLGVKAANNRLTALELATREVGADAFLFTPALPIIADLLEKVAEPAWIESLRRVKYLGNMCLVLELDRSLSDIYWLNVNDPGFPFVGVIEHTNFDNPANYGGSHIVFASRYLAKEDAVWQYADEEYLEFTLAHLQRMFPSLKRSWVRSFRVWRADYAQPVPERNYSQYVPGRETPFDNAWISTMAHIYPEDRGTNYAIREGRDVGRQIAAWARPGETRRAL